METDDSWKEVVKGVIPLKTNRYVDEISPKEVEFRHDKVSTVTFDAMKGGKSVEKDDFSQMDGCLAKRFKREEYKVQAVLDLHGVTEKAAYDKVCDFVKVSYAQNKRCILIITGKGWSDMPFSGKGVLRKAVPEWLSHSEISPLVLAFKNPSEAMGGAGALYILLRKKPK